MVREVVVDVLSEGWKGYVVRMINKVFLWFSVFGFLVMFICYWVGGFFVIDRGELEEKGVSLFYLALYCGCEFECFLFGYCKIRERDIFGMIDVVMFYRLGLKEFLEFV